MDRDLWKAENYREFLEARRELLATAANTFLAGLLRGSVAQERVTTPVLERPAVAPGGIEGEDEERALVELNQWLVEQKLPEGELMYELLDPESQSPVAILDLAWPKGLQEGLSQPVAVILDEPTEVEEVVNRAGFLFFTQIDDFQDYVNKEVLAMSAV